MLSDVHERVVAGVVPQIAQPTVRDPQPPRFVTAETLEGLIRLHCVEKSPAVFRDYSQTNQLVLGRFLDQSSMLVPESAKVVVDDIQQNLTSLTELWFLECPVSLTFGKFETHLSENFAITRTRFSTVPHPDETLASVLGVLLGSTQDASSKLRACWIGFK
jgi:hypothetical protein